MTRKAALTYNSRPLTLNAERRGNRHQRADFVRIWRAAFWALALESKIGQLERIKVTVGVRLKGHRSIDIDACMPSLKAAVDGLVDARVIPDDCHGHIETITITEPVLGAERDEFTLTIEEVPVA